MRIFAALNLWLLLQIAPVIVLEGTARTLVAERESGEPSKDETSLFLPCAEVALVDLKQATRHYFDLSERDGPANTDARAQAAAIAGHHSLLRQAEEAREWYERAVHGLEEQPASVQEAAAFHGLGWALGRVHQPEQAAQYLTLATSAWYRLLGPDSVCEGVARDRLANCLTLSGPYEDALLEYSQSLRILAQALGEESPEYLRACHGYANALSFLGRIEDALPYYHRVLETRRSLLPKNDPLLGWICHDLGWAFHGLGRILEAQALYREAMEIRQNRFPEHYRQSATGLASCLTDRGDFLGARQVLQEVLDSMNAEPNPSLHRIAVTLHSMAALRLRMKDYKSAYRLYHSVLDTLGPNLIRYPRLANPTYAGLSAIARSAGDITLAESLQVRVVELREELYGPESVFLLAAKGDLAAILADGGKMLRARGLFLETLPKLAALKEEARFAYGSLAQEYALMLWKSDRTSAAEAWIDTALTAFESALPLGHRKRIHCFEVASRIHSATGKQLLAWKEAVIAEREGRRLILLNIRGMIETRALLYERNAPQGLNVLLGLIEDTEDPSVEMVTSVWESLIESRDAVNKELTRRRRAAESFSAQSLWSDLARERRLLGNLLIEGPQPGSERRYLVTVKDLEDRVQSLEEQYALLVAQTAGLDEIVAT